MTRVFVSVPVRDTCGLEPLVTELSSIRGIKPSPSNQLHVTLCFIGDVPDRELPLIFDAVDGSVSGIGQGDVTLKGAGCFPEPRRARVLWAGVISDVPLEMISERIRSGLDAAEICYDTKPFKPHVTVARARDPVNLSELTQRYKETIFSTFPCGSVKVMKSELLPTGAKYSVLHSSPLA